MFTCTTACSPFVSGEHGVVLLDPTEEEEGCADLLLSAAGTREGLTACSAAASVIVPGASQASHVSFFCAFFFSIVGAVQSWLHSLSRRHVPQLFECLLASRALMALRLRPLCMICTVLAALRVWIVSVSACVLFFVIFLTFYLFIFDTRAVFRDGY